MGLPEWNWCKLEHIHHAELIERVVITRFNKTKNIGQLNGSFRIIVNKGYKRLPFTICARFVVA